MSVRDDSQHPREEAGYSRDALPQLQPELTIVMPVLNRAAHVRRAIDSALSQARGPLELIVVDGGSTDRTQEVVASIAGVRLLNAPRTSIYQALNMGIAQARAPLIGHLNSDDRYPPGALAAGLLAARSNPAAGIVRGRAAFVALATDGSCRPLPELAERADLRLSVNGILFGAPAINACFVRATTYRSIGLYDESLKISADREWLLRAILKRVPVATVNLPLYEYSVHPGSLTIGANSDSERQYAKEHLQLAARYLHAADRPTRSALRQWHAQEMVRLLVRGRCRRACLSGIAGAFRISPAWPVHAAPPLVRLAARRLGWALRAARLDRTRKDPHG